MQRRRKTITLSESRDGEKLVKQRQQGVGSRSRGVAEPREGVGARWRQAGRRVAGRLLPVLRADRRSYFGMPVLS